MKSNNSMLILLFANGLVFSAIAAEQVVTYEATQERPACCYKDGRWFAAGHDQTWWNRHYPRSWNRFGIERLSTGFSDIAEQPHISGFEREVYNSPK